jgi:hypothetical protein
MAVPVTQSSKNCQRGHSSLMLESHQPQQADDNDGNDCAKNRGFLFDGQRFCSGSQLQTVLTT